jgi:hypothetical protein
LNLDELSLQYLTKHTPKGMQLPAQVLQQQGQLPSLPVQQPQQALSAQQRQQQQAMPGAQQQQQPKVHAPPRPPAVWPVSPRMTTWQTRLSQATAADKRTSLADSQASKQTVKQQQQEVQSPQQAEPASQIPSPQQQQEVQSRQQAEPALPTLPPQQQPHWPPALPVQVPQEPFDRDEAQRLEDWEQQLMVEQQRLKEDFALLSEIDCTDSSFLEELEAFAADTKVFQQQWAELQYEKAEAMAVASQRAEWEADQAAWQAQQAASEEDVIVVSDDFLPSGEISAAAAEASEVEQLEQDSSSSSSNSSILEQLGHAPSSNDSSSSSGRGTLANRSSPGAGGGSSSRGSGQRGDGDNMNFSSRDSMAPLDPKEVEDGELLSCRNRPARLLLRFWSLRLGQPDAVGHSLDCCRCLFFLVYFAICLLPQQPSVHLVQGWGPVCLVLGVPCWFIIPSPCMSKIGSTRLLFDARLGYCLFGATLGSLLVCCTISVHPQEPSSC